MSFAETWDETEPSDSAQAALGADDIRDLKLAIRERLQFGGMYFPSTHDELSGEHNYLRLAEQGSDPLAVSNKGFVYTKDVSGVTELYYMTSAGTVVQLTSAGKLLISSLVIGSEAQGDIITRGASAWQRTAIGANGTVLKSDGTDPGWGGISTAPRAQFANLKVVRGSASQITVTADDLVLYDTNNNAVVIHSISEAIAITTSGASGLVAALSEAANTIYYIWIARKSSDGTVNGFLSTSAVYATVLAQLDSGYDQLALVSVVGNDNSSNLINFIQHGRRYQFVPWVAMASGNVGLNPWVAIDLTPSTLTFFVPSALSTHCYGTIPYSSFYAGITNDNSVAVSTNWDRNKYGFDEIEVGLMWEFDVITADTLYWFSGGASNKVWIAGFELNLL